MSRPLLITLVAVAVLAIVAGFGVLAVDRIRDAAAKTQCQNNLKHFALAASTYTDAHNHLPPGYVSGESPDFPHFGRGWGWGILLNPYVEASPFYKSPAIAESVESPAHADVLRDAVGYLVYRCPADRAAPGLFAVGPRSPSGELLATLAELPSSNYVGSCGTGSPADATGDGLLFRDSRVRLADIRDGTNTLLFAERVFADGGATWVGVVKGSHVVATSPGLAAHPPVEAECAVLGRSSLYGKTLRPTRPDQFSSNHRGGMNVAFANGHVTFMGAHVSPAVLRALSTRAAGDVAPGEF